MIEKILRIPLFCNPDNPYKLVLPNNEVYYLTEVLSDCLNTGGSSLVYKAYTLDSNNIKRKISLVKECYPIKIAEDIDKKKRDEEGIISCNSKDKIKINLFNKLFNREKERAKKEYEKICEIASDVDDPDKKDPNFFSSFDCFEANNTVYTILETSGGQILDHILKNKNKISLEWASNITLRLIENEKRLINKGYIHMDISPDNIFVSQLSQNGHEYCHFIDYNSSIRTDEIDKINLEDITFKDAYIAPEIKEIIEKKRKSVLPFAFENENKKSITPAIDIYAITKVYKKMISPDSRKLRVNKDAKINPSAIEEINKFLKNGLSKHPKDRFASTEGKDAIDVMEEDLKKIIKLLDNGVPFLPKSLIPPTARYFENTRNQEIKEILEIFKNNTNENFVYLIGMTGIGKSETSKGFGYYAQSEGYFNKIIFLQYEGNIKKTIAQIPFINYDESNKNSEIIYQDKISLLKNIEDNVLVIIDNCNVTLSEDREFFTLLKLPIKFLITTTQQSQEYGEKYTIDQFKDKKALINFFYNHAQIEINKKNDLCINRIIDLLQGHTLCLELIAKSMYAGDFEFDEIFEKLDRVGFNMDIDETISMAKDGRSIHNKKIDDLVKMLFNITDLSDKEKELLCYISLLPLEGIEQKLLKKFLHLDNYNDLNKIVDRSWVIRESKDSTKYIRMHSLIIKIIHEILKPDFNKCKLYYVELSNYINTINASSFIEIHHYAKYIDSSCTIIKQIDKESNSLMFDFSNYLISANYYMRSRDILEKISKFRKVYYNNNPNRKNLYSLNQSLIIEARTNYLLNEPREAVKIFNSINLLSEIKNIDELIQILYYYEYYNWALIETKEYKDAKYMYESAQKFLPNENELEKNPQLKHNLWGLYYNWGVLFYHLDDNENSKRCLYIALKYVEDLYGVGTIKNTSILNELAAIFSNEGNKKEALKIYQDVLDRRIETYGLKNSLVATSFDNKGRTDLYLYDDTGELNFLEDAKECFKVAFKIRKEIFHNTAIVGRSNMSYALLYYRLSNYYKQDREKFIENLNLSETYLTNAMKIYKNIDDKGEIAAVLELLGDITYLKDDSEKAIEFYKESLEIRRELFKDNNHKKIKQVTRKLLKLNR